MGPSTLIVMPQSSSSSSFMTASRFCSSTVSASFFPLLRLLLFFLPSGKNPIVSSPHHLLPVSIHLPCFLSRLLLRFRVLLINRLPGSTFSQLLRDIDRLVARVGAQRNL